MEGVWMGAEGSRRLPAIAAGVFCGLLWCAAAMGGQVLTYGGDFGLSIPVDAGASRGWMADAVVEVGEHHIIKDLDVQVSIAHSSVFDLQIFLEGPAGAMVCLNGYDDYENYFRGADYAQTVFDDEAAVAIEDGEAPFSGSFRPRAGSVLSVFDDTDCFGTWKLRIYDAFYDDAGTLESFELMITNPEPATGALLVLGLMLARLRRQTRA